MSARDHILARLRSVTPQIPPTQPTGERSHVSTPIDACVERFLVEAAALGIDCAVASTVEEVQRKVTALVHDQHVLSWDAEQLPYDVGPIIASVAAGVTFGRDARDDQARATVGVTGCDAALADTASIVLFSGPGRSRTASLLPPVHLALIERQRFFFTMADLFAAHAERLKQSASCTFITGPSRTADIELTLTLGIHGPGRVHVIIGP
jgi:L-lactate dehydrogenase complex protein LldG